MQNLKIIIFFLLFITLHSFASNKIEFTKEELNFIKSNPTITIGAERDWPPFDFVENDEYTGLAKDYLDLIEKKTGLKFDYSIDSWQNLLDKTKNKQIDLLPILSKNKHREEFLLYTKPYLSIRDYVFTDNNISYKSMDELKGKKIAIIKGYVQEKFIKNNYPSIEIVYVKNILESIDAVVTRKVDFIISNIAIINYFINKHSISNIKAQFHTKYEGNLLYMATRNDYPILKNIIDKALSSLTIEEKNRISMKWKNKKYDENLSIQLDLNENEKQYLKEKDALYIANELDWIPFDYYENNTPKGYTIDYIKLISQKLGLKPIFVTDKWTSLIKRLKNKEIDILPVIGYNKKREDFLLYTQSFMSQTLSIVTKKSRTDIINIDDLNNKKIGMAKGWHLTNVFKKNYPNANVIEFESLTDIFNSIENNFIDATIQNDLLASYYINKNYYGKLKASSHVSLDGFKSELYVGVRKDLNVLHPLIDKAISSITKEEQKALENKWINISKKINFTNEELNFIKNKKINVISTNNWSPFNSVENDELYGISVDFWNYIKDKANLKTSLSSNNKISVVLDSIKEKKSDILIAATKTNDREKYSIFSDGYLKSPIGIATLQDKNYIASAEELIGKKIAVGENSSAHRLLEEKYPTIKFVFVNDVIQGLEYVSENRVFAYVDIMPVLSHNIKNRGYSNLKITGQTGIDLNLKFMIRDDYPVLKSIVNKILNSMSPEDKDQIYKKWLNTNIQQEVDYSLLWKTILVFLIIIIFVLYKNKQLIDYQRNLKKTQKELENSLKNFKSLIDLNIAGVLIIENKKIKYLNDEIVNMLEYRNKSQLMNRELTNILKENSLIDIYKDDFDGNHEIEAIKVDGSTIPVLLKTKKIDFDGKSSFILSIINLTEIKNKEEIMFQQSKMASLGEMIGNIAHQWRQPLSSISTAASGIKVQKEYGLLNDELLEYNLDSITETTKFLSQTIDDFQNYIKSDKKKKKFDVKNSIEKVLTIVNASFKNNFINVNTKINSIYINGFENELNQALLNILTNSKDALKEIDEENRNIFINTFCENKFAVIQIMDTAGGIDEKIIRKVCEPYFTTKHKSQGTGLGLYMTHKIITDSMKGFIKIENSQFEDKKGAKVTLYIPIQ
ncbi:transporter substrate-binding domain-containing protein [Arcobacter sp. LA11]|uniref:transporter substrate-binding domain-containing protein n=1 Tax=Arcobacter sp. LA11 TaxID=1898176 RepID=UPI000933B1D7|nr:transporter substrate-binding domain-containing protein [Arcobacter sp. LA11]